MTKLLITTLQVGPTATPDNLISVPLSKSEAGSDPAWFDHYCFIGMGDHFLQFNYQPDQDCHDVLPLQVKRNKIYFPD